ncbi:hypothetical protein [Campylobacter blaseri]|nr:hypothetical protein [Campylobacter blaseri]
MEKSINSLRKKIDENIYDSYIKMLKAKEREKFLQRGHRFENTLPLG